jgi:hypothetical protein
MWKVYGFMEGKEGNSRYPNRDLPVYGPLPRKRWVPVKGERYRKVFKQTKAHQGNAPRSTKDYTAEKAAQYAAWLASRDGRVIPEGVASFVVWDSVMVPGKDKPEQRVRAVEYAEAKASYVHGSWVRGPVQLTVAIPNWDWVPVCANETLDLCTTREAA